MDADEKNIEYQFTSAELVNEGYRTENGVVSKYVIRYRNKEINSTARREILVQYTKNDDNDMSNRESQNSSLEITAA